MAHTLIIAHRGASRQAPENTLPAIEKALAAGAGMLFLDVQGTQDQEAILFADSRLDRTTDGAGRVAQQTLAQVRALDAGAWFGESFAGTRVPTLAEGLQATGSRARVMLNLNETRAGTPLADKVLAALRLRAAPAEDLLVFPDSEALKSFREAAPAFGYALALGEKVEGWVALEKALRLGLKTIRLLRRQATPALVRQAHAKGVQVLAYFADDEDEMRELLQAHVDGIVTGRPEKLRELLS